MFVTPRDWQAMAQIEAAQMLGTPEAAAKLAEAKRYEMLADVVEQQHRDIKRLQVQVRQADERGDEAMRRVRDLEQVVGRLPGGLAVLERLAGIET